MAKWTSVETNPNPTSWQCDVEFSENVLRLLGSGQNIKVQLISEEIDLTNASQSYFVFSYKNRIVNGDLELFVSRDFSGDYSEVGINAASWTEIELDLYPIGNDDNISNSIRHPAIDLSGFDLAKVHFMFVFTSDAGAVNWLIDNISIQTNYYAQLSNLINNGLRCGDLKSALSQLVGGHTVIPYTGVEFDVWDSHFTTDIVLDDNGEELIIWDMYSHVPDGGEPYEFKAGEDRDFGVEVDIEGFQYNREHTFPRSWWGGEEDVVQLSDIHFVIPTDSRVNELRSNYPYGETDDPFITTLNGSKIGRSSIAGYDDEVFEPIDEYKGDLARMQLYVALRYDKEIARWETKDFRGSQVLSGLNYPAYEDWHLDLLLSWHEEDPVSDKEMNRNNAVYSIQGNRNPFIDKPAWVGLIWGDAEGSSCQDLVSSNKIVQNESFRIYPNPFDDILTVEGAYEGIRVYNTEGKSIQFKMQGNQIDFSLLLPGIYLLQLWNDEREVIGLRKLVKL